jgi:hypothetical protein
MNAILTPRRAICLALISLALVAAPARAAGISFRNDLRIPIIVQGSCVVKKVLRRGQPIVVFPKKTGWDAHLKSGPRLITIYDGTQPTRVLFQGIIPFLGEDMSFAVRPSPSNPFQVIAVPLPP